MCCDITSLPNDHCGSVAYVAAEPDSKWALVIDPADLISGRVCEFLSRSGYTDLLIALTHEHFDHMSGVNRLRECFRATVVASAISSRSVPDPRKNLSRYVLGVDIHCAGADVTWDSGEIELEWNGMRIALMATPGHSPGSVCIAIENKLFTGDTLIYGTSTVVKLPGGNRLQLRQSIELLCTRFSGQTMVYAGHGPHFRLGEINLGQVFGHPQVQAYASCSS
jgi:glyoxylase-like metal-dependent hydrolase (beta-lactamase superfamily II)